MSRSARSSFSIAHGSWTSIRPEDLGERVQVRHLRGGTSEACWLSLAVGGKFGTASVAAECIATVIDGRVNCLVLGNEFQLAAGHHALLPPHIPFVLRTAGRSPATVLLHCNTILPETAHFEAD